MHLVISIDIPLPNKQKCYLLNVGGLAKRMGQPNFIVLPDSLVSLSDTSPSPIAYM